MEAFVAEGDEVYFVPFAFGFFHVCAALAVAAVLAGLAKGDDVCFGVEHEGVFAGGFSGPDVDLRAGYAPEVAEALFTDLEFLAQHPCAPVVDTAFALGVVEDARVHVFAEAGRPFLFAPFYFEFEMIVLKFLFGVDAAVDFTADMQDGFSIDFDDGEDVGFVFIVADGFDGNSFVVNGLSAFVAIFMAIA